MPGAVHEAMNRQEKARILYDDEIWHTIGMGSDRDTAQLCHTFL